jgi:hypothetical protein
MFKVIDGAGLACNDYAPPAKKKCAREKPKATGFSPAETFMRLSLSCFQSAAKQRKI